MLQATCTKPHSQALVSMCDQCNCMCAGGEPGSKSNVFTYLASDPYNYDVCIIMRLFSLHLSCRLAGKALTGC